MWKQMKCENFYIFLCIVITAMLSQWGGAVAKSEVSDFQWTLINGPDTAGMSSHISVFTSQNNIHQLLWEALSENLRHKIQQPQMLHNEFWHSCYISTSQGSIKEKMQKNLVNISKQEWKKVDKKWTRGRSSHGKSLESCSLRSSPGFKSMLNRKKKTKDSKGRQKWKKNLN